MSDRRLLLVHAHPDDECLQTGGVMAKYASEGAHVCLVTCTNGELGEIAEVPDLGSPSELEHRLGEIRVAELLESCDRLGVHDVRVLGYRDSGMDGTPGNKDPRSFVNQDREAAVGKVEAIIREVNPQVLITYNERGFYGHPDHIRAHEVAIAAAERTGSIAKIYYCVYPKWAVRLFTESTSGEVNEEEVNRIGTDDELITSEIDVMAFVPHKVAAMQAHRTQYGTTKQFLELPDEMRSMALGREWYVLVSSTLPAPTATEYDLFEGLSG